jgi:hypothetical protein
MSEIPGGAPEKNAGAPSKAKRSRKKGTPEKEIRQPQTGNGAALDPAADAHVAETGENRPDEIETRGGPPKGSSDADVIKWLTALPAVDRERLIGATAVRLGVKEQVVRAAIKEAQKERDIAEKEHAQALREEQKERDRAEKDRAAATRLEEHDSYSIFGGAPPPKPKRGDGEDKVKDVQRDQLIEVALTSGISYWHDFDGNAFATVTSNGQIARYRLRSAAFKRLLRLCYGDAHPNVKATAKAGFLVPGGVSDTTMNEVLPTLEGVAQQGPARVPTVRVCRDSDGTVWIDLCDETWRLVRVTASGWEIVQAADVPLVRSNGMRALPMPRRDPDALTKLRALLNLNPGENASKKAIARVENSFKLVVNFELVVLWPRGPYPILGVNGEHGSAKSTGCKVVRACTDPNRAPLRSVPRNPDDLFVTAQHGRLLPLDNVSHLSQDLSDVLCGIATGSGKGGRTLYTNGEETILDARNPIIVNGIEGLLTRADLADRCLSVTLPAISDEDRRDEAEMDEAIAAAVPGVLALLLDAMVTAMQNLPTLKLPRMPRMADFCRLACAAAPAFGWTADEIFTAIIENREIAVEAVIAADAVATAVLAFLEERKAAANDGGSGYLWMGTATELLGALRRLVPEETSKTRAWPETGHHLSGRLKRAAPALRSRGFAIITGRTKASRAIAFKEIAKSVSRDNSASPASQRHSNNLFSDLEVTLSDFAASPPPPSVSPTGRTGDAHWVWDDPATPSASPENAPYTSDNVGEYHNGDAGDGGDADSSQLTNFEDPDDDEGEL